MCCSLSEYRSRIGSFFPKNSPKPSKTTKLTSTINKFNKKLASMLLMILILATCMPNYSTSLYTNHKANNKAQHILNGNHQLNILHWNKGKSLFHNKLNDIDAILDKFKPHVISLCEANIDKIINNSPNNKYHDYTIEHTLMANKTNMSRNIILIKDGLVYKRRNDLEDEDTSTVWIELKLPNSKPILIASIYCQWSLPKTCGIAGSHNIYNQGNRWNKVLAQWTKAKDEKREILVLTDDNMDHNNLVFNHSFKIDKLRETTKKF